MPPHPPAVVVRDYPLYPLAVTLRLCRPCPSRDSEPNTSEAPAIQTGRSDPVQTMYPYDLDWPSIVPAGTDVSRTALTSVIMSI